MDIEKYLKQMEKKAAKYNYEFQMSGNPSSLRTYEKYEDLAEICRIAIRGQTEEDEENMKRRRNANAYIARVAERKQFARSKTYSLDDLIDELEKMKQCLV